MVLLLEMLLFAALTGALIGVLLVCIAGLSILRQMRLRQAPTWQTANLSAALSMLSMTAPPRTAVHRPIMPIIPHDLPLSLIIPEDQPLVLPAPQPALPVAPVDPQVAADAQRNVQHLMDYLWAEATRTSQQAS